MSCGTRCEPGILPDNDIASPLAGGHPKVLVGQMPVGGSHHEVAVAADKTRDVEEDLREAVRGRVRLVMVGVPADSVLVDAAIPPLPLAARAGVEAEVGADDAFDKLEQVGVADEPADGGVLLGG